MAMSPKQNSENPSFRGIVGRAFGSRSPRPADDPAPELDEVMTNLQISEQEYSQPFEINRVHFAETTAEPSPELSAHRERLEHLLESARQIEEMLAKEVAQARTLGENLKLDEKRAAAADAREGERNAATQAQAYAQNSETAAAHRAKVDAELAATRGELTAAEVSVMELQARLRDAQDLVVLSKAKVLEAESRSKEAAKRADLAQSLMRDAEIRVAKCREAREAAQAEVTRAEEIASSLALTAETLKRIRDLGR